MDLYSHPYIKKEIIASLEYNVPVISEPMNLDFLLQHIYSFNDSDTSDENEYILRSLTMEPVREDFRNNSRIVGYLIAIVRWDTFFESILPESVNGIIVVVESDCGENFTYTLNGEKETEKKYIGGNNNNNKDDYNTNVEQEDKGKKIWGKLGKHYNKKYEYLAQRSKFFWKEHPVGRSKHCHFDLIIYPSDEFVSQYSSNSNIIYSTIVAIVFVFMATIFFIFDTYVVDKQQSVTASKAVYAKAVVTSLFPKKIGQQLIDEEERKRVSLPKKSLLLKTSNEIMNRRTIFSSRPTSSRFLPFTTGDNNSNNNSNTGNDDHDTNDNDMVKSGRVSGKNNKPLADLFLHTTIIFADIVGFTAWSSTREPSQVFLLLETIYNTFDELAKIRGVFKVETVGDCYVAVTGLPNPQKDHVIRMSLFACDCLTNLSILTRQLELKLGPGTSDLGIRIGLHSGPVTAGVLRGERARFQLFGDTVNVASRMESTGEKNKIQISNDTAKALIESRKSHWFTSRQGYVAAKGKGNLQTHWLNIVDSSSDDGWYRTTNGNSSTFDDDDDNDNDQSLFDKKIIISNTTTTTTTTTNRKRNVTTAANYTSSVINRNLNKKNYRLVDWNVDMLAKILRQIKYRRELTGTKSESVEQIKQIERNHSSIEAKKRPIDEIVEIIRLPEFKAQHTQSERKRKKNKEIINFDSIQLDDSVMLQLHEYIITISTMYRDNKFHNFEHASHVTLSVVKLLNRIVSQDNNTANSNIHDAKDLHDHTYGIASDPLTQFAVVLSALLHDVDHTGLPNNTLVSERYDVASYYRNKSVAEQNSVDVAWNLLMNDSFVDLRRAIYGTEAEFKRFRQLLAQTILATDIMDKKLKELRNLRWDNAFREEKEKQIKSQNEQELQIAKGIDNNKQEESTRDDINRKATIVIEHLIQASDVAHTMQHWEVYLKWNARLFKEMYQAYERGLSETDPTDYWYQGEIDFFDFYIIPLAKKLADCGVFGVSSDEYMNYAQQNRAEWEAKGHSVVEDLIKSVQSEKELDISRASF